MTLAREDRARMRRPTEGPSWRTVAIFPPTFTRGLARWPAMPALLGAERLALNPGDDDASEIDAVVGWGEKSSTAAAIEYARRHELPYWRAEDGFLRSVGLGAAGAPPLSVVLDDLGIYYDARSESRLESILGGDWLAGQAVLARARRAIAAIRRHRLSKYNHAPPGDPPLAAGDRPRVLVVDQTRGDLSIACGLADASSFEAMLEAALAENPDAEVLVKTHPDVIAGKRKGYLERAARTHARVRLLGDLVAPIALLERVDRVYVVTSQLGFEALLADRPVVCFGAPFYAGWGVTEDRAEIPRRRKLRSVEEIFAAAYILYARYVDPDSGDPCEIERVIDHLALQREMFERNQGRIYCFGFRAWKRNYVRAYLRSPKNRIYFPRSPEHAQRLGFDGDARLLVWGQRETREVRRLAKRHRVRIWRMEDGFLRSVGLGSDLVTPSSLVVDRRGIYYDPTRASELEEILERGGFTEEELGRARTLRRRIVKGGVSKYNVGREVKIETPVGRRVILVPGQVEDDASIRKGCPGIKTNLALLEAVRADCPDAYLIYKPHPDVLSGNRAGRVRAKRALAVCDRVETEAALADCLRAAGEVHTLTSLVGFEALLRGLRVVVYGQPFYAGWGLTEDRHPLPRRTRKCTLDELVAGALLRYPRYLNRRTGSFTTPEAIIDELKRERDSGAGAGALEVSWLRRQIRKLIHVYKGMTHAP